MSRILWHNVPARYWMWKHQFCKSKRYVGNPWTCSCGSKLMRNN